MTRSMVCTPISGSVPKLDALLVKDRGEPPRSAEGGGQASRSRVVSRTMVLYIGIIIGMERLIY